MLIQAAQRMICHHCCCYSPWAFDLGLQRTDQSHGGLFLHSNFFLPFFTFFPPFFFFFSHISIRAHFWFSTSSSGENFSYFSAFLVRIWYVCRVQLPRSLVHYLILFSLWSLRSLLKFQWPLDSHSPIKERWLHTAQPPRGHGLKPLGFCTPFSTPTFPST